MYFDNFWHTDTGLVLGRRLLGAILHSSNEPGELSQWLCHDDSTINIVVLIIIIINTAHAFNFELWTHTRNDIQLIHRDVTNCKSNSYDCHPCSTTFGNKTCKRNCDSYCLSNDQQCWSHEQIYTFNYIINNLKRHTPSLRRPVMQSRNVNDGLSTTVLCRNFLKRRRQLLERKCAFHSRSNLQLRERILFSSFQISDNLFHRHGFSRRCTFWVT